ncbi:MAG: glycoside hydrolase [Bacteroidetes bacterium]|nr:glycoside hydrolase [Bacteroidota bacterium]
MRTLSVFGFVLISTFAFGQYSPSLFNDMKWRMIGPHRAGRTIGAVGVPQQPNVFYMAANNGGVWKTTDYGRTWDPIFDDQPTGSIGDIAVAPSNPNVLYVGSGEGVQRPDLSVGDGVYKSTDAGKTWKHLGLRDAQQIGGLAIDPTNENIVFVAALGHPYGANTERGVYRSKDGGNTWERVLYKDENTGAVQVTIDPHNPNIVFADLWAARQGPWENGAWQGKESGLYKSTDGGSTWRKITKGLPTVDQGLGRMGFCIAPSNSNRMYATVDAGDYGGIYRSEDAGESWARVSADGRHWSRGSDFAEVRVHPTNPDIVYSANVVTWKSEDGGKTWTGFRGAPGGDDYHRIWINPNNPDIMLIGLDQGAIITVNGGKTFSSWFNQPTAQFYHVSTDNAFPYNVYGGQQENGSVGIASRGNDGQITFREWHPVGVEEYGYVAADPLDPNIIYGGKITKYDKRTGQVQNIAPEAVRSGKYRFIRTAPVLFSPIDPKTLYFAGNVIFKTQNGGQSWDVISPDLSRESWDVPENIGIYKDDKMKSMPRRGVVYTLAPSPLDINLMWAGTDDGLIHVTRDGGKTWTNVTPPEITSWSKVSIMEASHFDKDVAYAAVNRIRLDDQKPHIYKTTDGGKTWKEIVAGLSADPINSVKEDPLTKGLLFAGSERFVNVSFDDGDHWQSLKLNMPPTSIRDLVIKDDDVVVGTHGRSFWILDNITPLRQMKKDLAAQAVLYKPQTAMRIRWSMNPDTPLPQEEPGGQNPPDGAVIDYYLNEKASDVKLEILNAEGKVIRTFSSSDKPYKIPELNIPLYWIRPQQILSADAGHHRFLWDMHYTPLDLDVSFPMSAIYQNTAPNPTSPWVMPGEYSARLTVNGQSQTQKFTVKMDPRVTTTLAQLKEQHDLSMMCYDARKAALDALNTISKLESQLNAIKNPALAKAVAEFKTKLTAVKGSEGFRRDNSASWNSVDRISDQLFGLLQEADMPVTAQAKQAMSDQELTYLKTNEAWKSFLKVDLPAFNKTLKAKGEKELK